ncbi:hypothetical protein LUX33_09410 [Actinomadura madurae]|nr:hypothetical protein [Actinomadura madurae]MCP9948609.1 hypothetical protein [Actinomadura madurae]
MTRPLPDWTVPSALSLSPYFRVIFVPAGPRVRMRAQPAVLCGILNTWTPGFGLVTATGRSVRATLIGSCSSGTTVAVGADTPAACFQAEASKPGRSQPGFSSRAS